MKDPKELFSSGESKNLSQIKYLITKELFNSNNCYKNNKDFEDFINKLEAKEIKKLEALAHFYYFICQPYKNSEDIREELRLVAITSLVEGMMQEVEYKDFFSWFQSIYGQITKIENYSKIKEEYLATFGSTRKIKTYFEKYILEDDKETLLECIKPFRDNKKFIKFDSIEKIAQFLYNMRCEFVHEARMKYLCPEGCHVSCIIVKRKPYKINIGIREFMKIFERSFIEFWQKQI
ncbi:hypothetical protein KKG58_01110 [Patescibacteria group bacterium]|nr:hypothetical protein [Patescibacteria group bacterium]